MSARLIIPSPADLGFLPKFSHWYPDQVHAIDRTLKNTKRFTALAMPTGSGKSVTGIAVALLHAKVHRAIYLTSTKGLQDQLSGDFANLGLFDVRGAKNYPCRAIEPGAHLDRYRRGGHPQQCDEGPCHAGVKCQDAPNRNEPNQRPNCHYYGSLYDARRAFIVSTNYALYLTQEEYAQGLGTPDLLILDEAHDADKELESFLTTEITPEDATFLRSNFLKSDRLADWRDWAMHHYPRLTREIESLSSPPPRTADGVHRVRKGKRLLGKLERLAGIQPLEWLLDNDGMRAKFAPLHVSRYAEACLFRGIPHVMLMSATLTRKTTQLLGVDPDNLLMMEVPSRFALERRPVISIHTMPPVRVDFNMKDDTKYMWMRRIDRLIDPRRALGWKGIIHTVSYQRMRELIAASDHRDIMMVHDSNTTRDVIKLFKQMQGPAILVSPSLITGWDFPGDECRFQIIGKVPQIKVQDPIMKARVEVDEEYTGYLAMQKLVQASGRGMRGPDDWCETFIIDDHFGDWFFKKYRKHAPRWFIDAVEYIETYPDPMNPAEFAA